MKTRIKDYAVMICFLFLCFGMFFGWIAMPDQEVSVSERRKLAKAPAVTAEGVLSGKTMKEFGTYLADQFPFRDGFRTMKALMQYQVYGQKDNNGVYLTGGQAGKLEYPLDEAKAERFSERLTRVYDMYLQGNDRVFYGIVPDKNYFLAEKNGYPSMDYERQAELVRAGLPEEMREIRLFDVLSIDDYYRTDTHWRSERLFGTGTAAGAEADSVVGRISSAMGFSDRISETYEIKTLPDPFYGVYYGQAAIPMKPDELRYIENPAILGARVTDYDKSITGGVYYGDYGKELDPYAWFLNGSSSLLVIENPLAETEDELILFRDSFGSSLAPWFVEAYKKITLADIRYISPEVLERFVSFEGADVLFLYSTLIINHSETIR